MSLKTTINISMVLYDYVKSESKEHDVSISDIVAITIKKILTKKSLKQAMTRCTSYQKRRKKGDWKKLHVTLSEQDYEILADMRNFLKISVSSIISEALKDYLDDLLDGFGASARSDNYPCFSAYFVTFLKGDGVFSYTVQWGIRDKDYASEEMSDNYLISCKGISL